MSDNDQAGNGQDEAGLQRLYPQRRHVNLTGLYLGEDLRSLIPKDNSQCYVYTNFLTSLDGRIAVTDPDSGQSGVPGQTANHRDWRLLLELAAPADALIMSGRYLRELSTGKAQSLPPYSGDVSGDLLEFRKQLGLPGKPVIVFLSRALDIPEGGLDKLKDREILIVTTEAAPKESIDRIQARGIEVISSGESTVDGRAMIASLARRGLRLIYSIAGPEVMHLLLAAGVLQRIYLTTVLRVLAGTEYATLIRGPELCPPGDFNLTALYLDSHGPDGVEQLLQVYDRVNRPDDSG